MPYYSYEQNELIQNLLKEAIEREESSEALVVLKDTLAASDLDYHTESCREDVLIQLEGLVESGYLDDHKQTLTDEQIDDLSYRAANYDQSHYNEFISECILNELRTS